MTREEILEGLYEIKNWKCNGDAKTHEVVAEAIKALEQETKEITLEDVKEYCEPRCLTIISNALLYDLTHPKIKALEQEPRWIPVSERYPKPEDDCKPFLVTDDKGVMSVQVFYMSIDEEPQPYFSGIVNVIAWMPLPKAYSEVEE